MKEIMNDILLLFYFNLWKQHVIVDYILFTGQKWDHMLVKKWKDKTKDDRTKIWSLLI